MIQRPVYREGYTLTDNLEVEPELRAYVTHSTIDDPMGHLDAYHILSHGKTIHHKDYY